MKYVALMLLILAVSTSRAQDIPMELTPNTRYSLSGANFRCSSQFGAQNEFAQNARVDASCRARQTRAYIDIELSVSGTPGNSRGVEYKHVSPVHIADVTNGDDPSLLPIHISLKEFEYAVLLTNLTALNEIKVNDNFVSFSVDLVLRHKSDDPDYGTDEPVARTTLVQVQNDGIGSVCVINAAGSFVASGDALAGARDTAACLLDGFTAAKNTLENITVDSFVRAGAYYDIEVVANALVTKGLSASDDAEVLITQALFGGNPRTMRWSDMTIALGVDPQAAISGLRDELNRLRDDFDNHYHTYQTGQGQGHNNTAANTPPPVVPGGDTPNSVSTQSGVVAGSDALNTVTVPASEGPDSQSVSPPGERPVTSGGGAMDPLIILSLGICSMIRLARRKHACEG